MRLFEFHSRTRLDEMNVANGDELTKSFTQMFDTGIKDRGGRLDPALRKLFLKRAMRAFQNDEAATMVAVAPLTAAPENAPAWMQQAFQRGETVVRLQFKDVVGLKMPHILDWLTTDANAGNAVRAVPEATFIDALYAAADKYYALQSSRFRDATPIDDEPGREVVLTFRAKADEAPQMFEDKSLKPNEHGKVVMFWAKLTDNTALAREGNLMGHCVGGDSYARAVKHDSATIFSLRDDKNRPHVTIEAQGSTGDWQIHQVKGKSNRPPVAKYAPFVKAFLNEVGATATSTGRGDIRGVGLFTTNGRYGTAEEVGSKTSATFKNGDSLRDVPQDEKQARRSSQRTELTYVQKDGSHPLSIVLTGEIADGHMVSAKLREVTVFRNEMDRHSALAQNLIGYLNQNNIGCGDRALETYGIYYNAKTKTWGSLSQAGDELWSGNGVAAYSIKYEDAAEERWGRSTPATYETVFADTSERPLFKIVSSKTPGKGDWRPTGIIAINKAETGAQQTELLVSFLNGVSASLPSQNEQKDLLRNRGVATNRQGQWVTPDDLKPLFSGKKGSVRVSGAFVYVLDKEGTTLLGVRSKNKTLTGKSTSYGREQTFDWIVPNKAHLGLEILAEFSTAHPDWTFDNCTGRGFISLGYVDRAGRLVSVSDLSKGFKVRGHAVTADVTPNGTDFSMTVNGQTLKVETNEDKMITRIALPEGQEDQFRAYIPLIMKAGAIVCRRGELLRFGLKEVGGRVVALDAKKDAMLIGLAKGLIDLGDGYEWEINYRERPDYGYRDGSTRTIAHVPTISGSIKRKGSYQTLIEISANDPMKGRDDSYTPEFSYQDPSFKMRRELPDGVSRDHLYKIATNFLKFYHDRVMPMETDCQGKIGA